MRSQQQSFQLTVAEQQTKGSSFTEEKRVRHIYLEQQNIYGRFQPYLLLKDQLQSQVDSSGNTALHHMCSHNSPYIPLFLQSIKQGESILNKKSKMGHTPLDVAGLYCSKQYIQLLKQKGAIDNGNVDYWAIQGANPTNWSGKVYADKKPLLHWAAYNDMPDVIAEYARKGIGINDVDSNGFTPMDLTILNKSYKSMAVLAELGEKPKAQLLKSTDSKSIKEYFENINESRYKKIGRNFLKSLTFLFYLILCLIVNLSERSLGLVAICLVLALHILIKKTKPEKYMNNGRKTQFVSQLFMDKKINRGNHFSYILFHIAMIVCGVNTVFESQIKTHIISLCILVILVFIGSYFVHLISQIYGICHNLTYDEMFYSYRWAHLWEKIKLVDERKFIIREFSNSQDRGVLQNIKDYFTN